MTQRCEYIARQSLDGTAFDNTYQAFPLAFTSPIILFKIVNNSNVDVDISVDGSTDHDFVPAGGFSLYDLRANKGHEVNFGMKQETQFYVKGAVAADSGNVYLIAMRERP